ncbi:MAG TPA: sialidase family protein, partial [Sumerlaeia bacterium]|nr:sialidase family protein [Sumerlaeia bacterium]
MRRCLLRWIGIVPFLGLLCQVQAQEEATFVAKGEAKKVTEMGEKWRKGKGFLEGAGRRAPLYAGKSLGPRDFHVRARLSLKELAGTGAAFLIGGDIFGFDGEEKALFVEGATFGKTHAVGRAESFITPGKPFLFEAVRAGSNLALRIDGKEVVSQPLGTGSVGPIGLRPWRGVMRVYDFSASGNLEDVPQQQRLFVSGENGYHTYRVPSLVVGPEGALLAFCEGRKNGAGETGNVDILLRRSQDGGKTWSEQQLVAGADDDHVWASPCAVVDKETGVVWLLTTWNRNDDTEEEIRSGASVDTRRVYVCSSKDDGKTWSESLEITPSVKRDNWTWYGTGPGAGIQLERNTPIKGFLFVPCNHTIEGDDKYFGSHLVYSPDHGESWSLGLAIGERNSEFELVELADGGRMLNMRNRGEAKCRIISRTLRADEVDLSKPAKEPTIWSEPQPQIELRDPHCQASFRRYSFFDTGGRNRILFLNPASETRDHMTLRLTYDEGATWPLSKLLYAGPSAYSGLAVLPDRSICCLYEAGIEEPDETIVFTRVTLEWLTDWRD